MRIITFVMAGCVLTSCSNASFPPSEYGDQATDTGEIFDLSRSERDALEQAATKGDKNAAYRLAEYWGMVGGESGQAGDPQNTAEEERWLKLASSEGHEPAKLRLATLVANRDCARAREMLAELARSSTDDQMRQSAHTWMQSDSLCPKS